MSFEVQGAWARRSVSIAEGDAFETQTVVWLQAGPCYADIRVPFHPSARHRCFSGRSGWDGDGYRWTHDLDLEGDDSPAADDWGQFSWEDGMLVERGSFRVAHGEVRYKEIWVRLAGDDGPSRATEGPGAQLIQVGRHAITVVDRRGDGGLFSACYRMLGPAGWQIEAAIGDAATTPAPDQVPSGWTIVHARDTAVAR